MALRSVVPVQVFLGPSSLFAAVAGCTFGVAGHSDVLDTTRLCCMMLSEEVTGIAFEVFEHMRGGPLRRS